MKTAILITGICGSGKTHYASARGLPVLSYDSIRNYQARTTNYDVVKRWAEKHADEPVVALDAWGFGDDPDLTVLHSLLGGDREIVVRYLYLTPLELRLSQLRKEANGEIRLQGHQRRFRQHTDLIRREMQEFARNTLRPLQKAGIVVQWYFRQGSIITPFGDDTHLHNVIQQDPATELLEWIDAISDDPTYQTIELDGEILRPGYMKSHDLWDQIRSLGIGWQAKSVCDLACFHGYFSFATEDAGASHVVSYDLNPAASEVFARLALLRNSKCEFSEVDLSGGMPPGCGFFDVALLLNSLHHIVDSSNDGGREFLEDVFSSANKVVATINPDQMSLIQSHAADAGLFLHRQHDTHPLVNGKPRQLLYFSTTPSVI